MSTEPVAITLWLDRPGRVVQLGCLVFFFLVELAILFWSNCAHHNLFVIDGSSRFTSAATAVGYPGRISRRKLNLWRQFGILVRPPSDPCDPSRFISGSEVMVMGSPPPRSIILLGETIELVCTQMRLLLGLASHRQRSPSTQLHDVSLSCNHLV
ncbi:hypothetical protein EDD15DRAFT_1551673 [Pisolithus albus]|nr:hypothetical protein EDD15DRAFT_1551673 [Pisolithus albus]